MYCGLLCMLDNVGCMQALESFSAHKLWVGCHQIGSIWFGELQDGSCTARAKLFMLQTNKSTPHPLFLECNFGQRCTDLLGRTTIKGTPEILTLIRNY